MPSKKKKYNARFPAGRIKKIMQSDEEIGKVAQAVPVIISRTLELFVESLLTKTLKITNSRNARTLSTSHMKQCIMAEQRFDFLRELVKNIPDISVAEEAANYNEDEAHSSPEEHYPDSDTPFDLSMASTSTRACPNPRLNGNNQNGYTTPGATTSRSLLKRSSSACHSGAGTDIVSPVNSVIMHTTAIGKLRSDYQSPKLARSESAPMDWALPQQEQKEHYNRLKQQNSTAISSEITPTAPMTSISNAQTCKQARQHQREPSSKQPQLAVQAPIVVYEFRDKPVVKIDYSNVDLATAKAIPAAPLSAPANISAGDSLSYNFNTSPIINIDLSNIVANPSSVNTRPAATTLTLAAAAAAAEKSIVAERSEVMRTGACFQLDEDYDNF